MEWEWGGGGRGGVKGEPEGFARKKNVILLTCHNNLIFLSSLISQYHRLTPR